MSGEKKYQFKTNTASSSAFNSADKPVHYDRPSSVTQQLYEIGKLPPQAVELEEAVVGALMLERGAITEVIDLIIPESFYKEAHGRIFNAIYNLFNRNEPVDILTVTNELKSTGELELVGGAYYISQLTNRVASAANVEFHARILVQKFIQRELIRVSSETIKEAYDDTADVFDLLDSFSNRAITLGMYISRGRETAHISEVINQEVETFTKRVDAAKNGIQLGIDTGLIELNACLNGWQNTDLVIIAARPAMGKTSFVLGAARASAASGKPVAVFSLEMASVQLVERLLISDSEISSSGYKKGTLGNGELSSLMDAREKYYKMGIYIDDTPALSVFEMRAKARRLKQKHGIQLIIVDYLQLMTTGNQNERFGRNREQEISTISRNLKAIAKELNVPVLALSQLSRETEKRGDKRPQLSDLRESGAIEADADVVMFIHRPEYYGFTQDGNGNNTAGLAEVIIAKHRNGAVGTVNVRFIDRLAKFTDLPESTPTSAITPNTNFQHESKKTEEDPF